MKKFNLTATITISVYTEVEAETLKKAIEISQEREVEDATFSGGNKKYAWISDEYDGEVQHIHEN